MSGMLSDPKIAQAIVATLTTPDEQGRGNAHRDANVTDALYAIALAIEGLTGAIDRLRPPSIRGLGKLR